MRRVSLGELVTLRRGASYKGSLVGDEGIPLLGLGTIQRNGRFKSEKLRRYAGDSPERMQIYAGDLYVSLKDMTQKAELLGAVSRVPGSIQNARLTQDTIALDIIDGSRVTSEYLYASLLTPRYREFCRSHGTGTTNLDLSQADFLSYEINYVSVNEQVAITTVLAALDDKIAANRAIISGCDRLRTGIWSAAVHDSSPVPLTSVAEFVNGKAFTKNASGTGPVVIRIAELNSGIGPGTIRNDIDVDERHLARPGDLLMSWSGSLVAARWFRDEAIVNQHIFKVIPKDGVQLWKVASAVESRLAYFRSIAADKATTMGHIQRKHLEEVINWPTHFEQDTELLGDALWQRALRAEVENENLARTRDELLPLLMDGRITVKHAEDRVSEVV